MDGKRCDKVGYNGMEPVKDFEYHKEVGDSVEITEKFNEFFLKTHLKTA